MCEVAQDRLPERRAVASYRRAISAEGDEPWPWRRVEREGSEPFSELAEDVLGRLSYKVLQVTVMHIVAGDSSAAARIGMLAGLSALSMALDTAAKEQLCRLWFCPSAGWLVHAEMMRHGDAGGVRVAQKHARCPQVRPTVGPELPFEAIIVRCGAMEGSQPTIVMPHGGPHRCIALLPLPAGPRTACNIVVSM